MMTIKKTFLASAMGLTMFSTAFAQDATVQPSSVVESYNDWTLACDNFKLPAKKKDGDAKKADEKKEEDAAAKSDESTTLCEVYQTYTNPKSKKEIARFFFAYIAKDGKAAELRAGIRTLVDVSFDKKPVVTDGDKNLLEGKVARCAGSFCYVEFDVNDAKLKELQSAKKPQFAYPLSNERMIRIGMSSKGLEGAVNSLKKKQKEKK